MEYAAFVFQPRTQLVRIDEIAVVRYRHVSFKVIDDDGLGVFALIQPRSAVTDVAYGDFAAAQFFQNFGRKYVVYQTFILISRKNSVVVYDNSRRFLSAVLQSEQGIIRCFCHLRSFAAEYTENAAFFMNFTVHVYSPAVTRSNISL